MSPRNIFRLLLLALVCSLSSALAQEANDPREVMVRASTRLDWTFALSNQSRVDPPPEWLRGYESTRQRYELYLPPSRLAGKSGLPLILFISAGDAPAGWSQFKAVCQREGIAFASPFEAGNNSPLPQRVHTVLDVLDDIRRNQAIDPDRTYLAGFSGGGRIACAIAFALPELFGGVLPICAGGELREEPWLRHRAIERLSIALVTGTNDFNRGEVERFRGPMLTEMGFRTRVTVVPKLGHGIPDAGTLAPILEWLDKGVDSRRELADKHPASRINGNSAATREEWSQWLLDEGRARIKHRKTIFSGLMQLQGVMSRWPDLPAAAEARQILLDYDSRPDKPWEADDIAEQRKFLIARTRALDAYAAGDLPEQYQKQRPNMLKAAIELWEQVVEDGQDARAVAEAKRRLPVLKKLAETE